MKTLRVFGLGIFLVLMLMSLSYAQTGAKFKSGEIWFGGQYSMSNVAYRYNYSTMFLGETLSLSDELFKSNFYGYNGGAGYFTTRSIEVFGGAYYATINAAKTTVSISIPNTYLWNDIATDTYDGQRVISQLDLVFGIKYHLMPGEQFNIYLGAGGLYASATVQLMNNIYYYDSYDSNDYHTVEIYEVPFQEEKTKGWGGFGIGGIEFGISRSFALYAEGIYKFVKKEVLHPFSADIDQPVNVTIDMGGLIAAAGIRIYF